MRCISFSGKSVCSTKCLLTTISRPVTDPCMWLTRQAEKPVIIVVSLLARQPHYRRTVTGLDDQDGLGLELWSYALRSVNQRWALLESQSHPPDFSFQGTGGDLTAERSTNTSNNASLTPTSVLS